MSATADVIEEFYRRIDKSVMAGQALQGWTIERQPVESVQGLADKPSLSISMPTVTEVDSGSGMASPTVTMHLGLSTAKEVTRAGMDKVVVGISEHLDAVESVKNAVEQWSSDPRTPDVLMLGLLIEPMRLEQAQSTMKSDSFNTALTLTMKLRAVQRGAR
jgi:hypothetical protein